MLYEVHRSCFLASAMRVAEALTTYNQLTHHKTFPVHGVTKPTPTSWYCEPLHYFANSNQMDSWTHLPIPSNNPSQWTHHKAYSCKGCQNQTLTLNTMTSNDWVNSVHQLHKMVHDKDIHKFVYYYMLKMKCKHSHLTINIRCCC